MSQRPRRERHEPIDHHYAPQFLLRNFAIDDARLKVGSLAKHGDRAVWKKRAIKSIGFEKELYVHSENSVSKSVETDINRNVETPISQSETWKKIASGRSEELDASDKPLLYALVRHLSTRTPHYRKTIDELEAFANDPNSTMPFSDEERRMYEEFQRNPDSKAALLSIMPSETSWQADAFEGALVAVWRSRVPLRCGTTPVLSLRAPNDPRVRPDGPGTVPTQLVVSVSPTTAISLVLGDFEDGFLNAQIPESVAIGINRQYIGQFAHFDQMRHVVCGIEGLAEDMVWANFRVERETEFSTVFRRSLLR